MSLEDEMPTEAEESEEPELLPPAKKLPPHPAQPSHEIGQHRHEQHSYIYASGRLL